MRELLARRSQLLTRYTERYPEIVLIDRQLAELRDNSRASALPCEAKPSRAGAGELPGPRRLGDVTPPSTATQGAQGAGGEGERRLPLGYGGTFDVRSVSSGGVARRAIFMHPPWEGDVHGKVIGAFTLDLPRVEGLRLELAFGLMDGASGISGVRFEIAIDGQGVFVSDLDGAAAWRNVSIDLSRYAGRRISLELAVDSRGSTSGDWAAIATPRVVSPAGLVSDLLKLAPKATASVILGGNKGKAHTLRYTLEQQASLLVNQLGYDIGAPKRFLVQMPDNQPLPSEFRLKRRGSDNVVFKGTLEPAGNVASWQGMWQRMTYARGDFSRFDTPGEYLIEVNAPHAVSSPPFQIKANLLYRALVPVVGLQFLGGRRSDLGGWKADQVKSEELVLFAIGPAIYGLAGTLEASSSLLDEAQKASALGEMRWGLKGLINAQRSDGRFVGTNPDGRDDLYAGIGIASFARCAQIARLRDEERADCLARAKRARAYYRGFRLTEFGRNSAEGIFHALMVFADVELHRATGEQQWLAAASEEASLAAEQWRRYWPHTVNPGIETWQGGVVPGALLSLALQYPGALPEAGEQLLRRWTEGIEKIASQERASPFAIVQWDSRHFFAPVHGGWHVGENGRYITTAWAVLLAGRWRHNDALTGVALEHLNWIMGANPGASSMIRGIGTKAWPSWHGLIQQDNGAIMNGLVSTGSGDDSPNIEDTDYPTTEPWAPYNGWLLIFLNEFASR